MLKQAFWRLNPTERREIWKQTEQGNNHLIQGKTPMSSLPFYSGLKIIPSSFYLTQFKYICFDRWLNKLIGLGKSKILVIDDLYECLSADKSKKLGDTLQR